MRVADSEFGQAVQQRERGYAATHSLGVVEEEDLKLSEVLKKVQAAIHLGVAEAELLKLSEVLKKDRLPFTWVWRRLRS